MARPRSVNDPVSVEEILQGAEAPPAFDAGLEGADLSSSDVALSQVLSTLGDETEARVIVYSRPDGAKRDKYLFETTVGDFSQSGISDIQSSYGEGAYIVRVIGPGGTILALRKIDVGAPVKKLRDVANSQGDIAAMLERQGAMFMAGLERIAAMSAAQKPQGMGVAETIQLIGALKGIGGNAAPAPHADPIDMLTKVLNLQKMIAPLPTNGDGEVPMGTLALEAMRSFGPMIAQSMANKPADAIVPVVAQSSHIPALPVPVPAANPVANPVASITPEKTVNDLELALTTAKPIILTAAAMDADPGSYAGMICDMVPHAEIKAFLDAPDWWPKLMVTIPEAEPYHVWFDELRETVLAYLRSEGEPPESGILQTTENSDTVSETTSQESAANGQPVQFK